jgi:type I restriction enzyme S subunit
MTSDAPTRLGDHVALQRGTTYKSALLDQPGPYLLGLASIERNGGFRRERLRTYGGESPAKLLLRPGDLYVALKDITQAGDLLGAVARVPADIHLGRLTQDTVKLEIRSTGSSADYLYWLLRTPQFREYCRAHSMGTTNLSISREDFLAFPVPSLTANRRALLDVLECLDRRIDSNRRLAGLLEETAATLFRARFADFVGVTEVEETEIGRIPRGWRVVPFSEVVTINPPVSIKKGEVLPYIEMAAVDPWSTRPATVIERPYSGGARFEPGDTLMARITGCIENGKGAFVDFLDGPGSGSTEFLVLRAREPWTPEAVFFLSRSDRVRTHAMASMTGSSGRQRVQVQALAQLKIPVPPSREAWIEEAALLAATLVQTRGLWEESRTLRSIRDALLPKLISARIRGLDVGDPGEVSDPALA